MQRKTTKLYDISTCDNPLVLLLKSRVEEISFYGTKTFGTNFAITATGTLKEGMKVRMVFNSAITIGANMFTILGTVINKTVILTPFEATCEYTNSAWTVVYHNFVPGVADGTTLVNSGGTIAVGTVGNTQFSTESGEKLPYSKMNLTGSIVAADLHSTFSMPVAQLAALTPSEIVITNGSGVVASAAVATYPSLAELIFVKGATSNLQSQIGTLTTTFANYTTTTALNAMFASYSTTSAMNAAIAAAISSATILASLTTLTTSTDLSGVGTLYQQYLLDATSGAVNLILPDASALTAGTPLRVTLIGAANSSAITPKVAGQIIDMTQATSATETLTAVGQFRQFVVISGKWHITAK